MTKGLIDLTQIYRDGMFSQRLFPPVKVQRCIRIEESRLNVTCLDVCVHHGTHIDAPLHFIPGGRSADQITLEEVCGPAVGLEVHRGPGEAISARDLDGQSPKVEKGDIVFIHTGWGPYFNADTERYQLHPYLGIDAAEWLLDRHVKLVALDVPTPDMPEPVRKPGFDWPVHHMLLGGGTLIAEHLNHLELVAGMRFRAFAFPLPIAGADGSPARFVAEVG
jgi:kynurenine formamidase